MFFQPNVLTFTFAFLSLTGHAKSKKMDVSVNQTLEFLSPDHHGRELQVCKGFSTDGFCWDLQSTLENHGTDFLFDKLESGLGKLVGVDGKDEDKNGVWPKLMDNLVSPLMAAAEEAILDQFIDLGFCFGDFDGKRFETNEKLQGHACDSLPIKDADTYGVAALKFPIKPTMQAKLAAINMWTNVDPVESVEPNFCLAMKLPNNNCDQFTFAMSLNDGVMTTVSEMVPAAGVGDVILSMIAAIVDLGVEQVTFGVSMGQGAGGGLSVPVRYYNDGKFLDGEFPSHIVFSFEGALDLFPDDDEDGDSESDSAPDGDSNGDAGDSDSDDDDDEDDDELISINGAYTRAFHFGAAVEKFDSIFGGGLPSNPARLLLKVLKILGSVSEVTTAELGATLNLEDFTHGLLGDIDMGEIGLTMMRLPSNTRGMEKGSYMTLEAEADIVEKAVLAVCKYLDGALVAIAGKGCKKLTKVNAKAKIGVVIKQTSMEFDARFPGLNLYCKVKDLVSSKAKMNCDIDGKIFGIVEDAAGYTVKKLKNIAGEAADVIGDVGTVGKDSIKKLHGFKKEIVGSLMLNGSREAFKVLDKVFPLGSDKKVLEYNFVKNRRCEGHGSNTVVRIFSTKEEKHINPDLQGTEYVSTREECLKLCGEYVTIDQPTYLPPSASPCCQYTKYGSNNQHRSCHVGREGKRSVNEGGESASTTFLSDYHALFDPKLNGDTCDKDKECISGLCSNRVCKADCSSDPLGQCYPNDDDSVCHFQSSNCMQHQGPAYCSLESNTCKLYSGPKTTAVPTGQDFTIRFLDSARYWYMDSEYNGKTDGPSSSIDRKHKFQILRHGNGRYSLANMERLRFFSLGSDAAGHADFDANNQNMFFDVVEAQNGIYTLKFGHSRYPTISDNGRIVTTTRMQDAMKVVIECARGSDSSCTVAQPGDRCDWAKIRSQCRNDAFCNSSKLCVRKFANGGKCGGSDWKCRSGFCSGGDSKSKCEGKRAIGANCGKDSACLSPAKCLNGRCSEGKKGHQCGNHDHCNAGLYCTSNKCATKLGVGGTCGSNDACRVGTCRNSRCSEGKFDHRCGGSHHCNSGLYCENSKCAKLKRLHENCSKDAACGFGTSCRNGRCSSGGEGHRCGKDDHCNSDLFCKSGDKACRKRKSRGGRCNRGRVCLKRCRNNKKCS